MRHAYKRDEAEPEIVKALLRCGALVERMDRPVDLLVRYGLHADGQPRIWLLEVKTPGNHAGSSGDARQAAQRAFCQSWAVPIVKTAEDALRAVGAMS